ncbi:gamma carbonic anhydrase family protein [Raineya orbicola]|jgi:carbonic anhydrase/acetyltransferase-like protein (isoleucine patch superfamily)|uniref:Carbonic anhydrase/acetyltransferase isoleucine patch superfamily n=1 Tax=Raineya orbicola TaxID=2016530 RepID=A0A2N3ICJ6_9BACT|nr:gamma carbonic anhydrase family protein [Raineya orbicola]PKQ68051.1 Carbonic anhydrase/acetyltransferase isoleucine patch superfamily [Raineya orbicola]
MALIVPVRGFTPKIGKNCFLAPNATIIGDVEMGEECTIWFNAVVRGDVNSIRMGNRCNVQDGAVIHCTYQKSKVVMGNNVSVAHNAIIHGCTIEDNVLVGMGAIIMDNAYIGTGSIIAAGAVVLAGTRVEPHSIWAGNPAKFLKSVGEKASEIERIAGNYPMYASWFEQNSEASS